MKFLSQIFITLTAIFFMPQTNAQEHLTHSIWNDLTSKHVSTKGNVDYKGFLQDEKKLDVYLNELSQQHPDKSWKKNDQLAFWINTYNAFTVKLILKYYPVNSIKDIAGSIYKINTPWDIKFIHIDNETYDLNNIEHGILRKKFKEPRIHFALNCASVSCPKLRNEAYIGEKIDAQLDDQAKCFINNPEKNKITAQDAQLSLIFKWFAGDFKSKKKNAIDFINKYSEEKIVGTTKISYLSYDWNLNE